MSLENLKQLRDEIALDIHLAGMELKTRFQELEKAVAEAERTAREEAHRAARNMDDLAARLTRLRADLKAAKK